jgi:2-polyprenyl-3-methyl-5-hydroxy-6-metoxy-1,4-benzoquinol methylase
MSPQEIKNELENLQSKGLRWWHSYKINESITTPGLKNYSIEDEVHQWRLDDIDFKDKSVLDIGALDGGFSFYSERRGASRVVPTDKYYDNFEHPPDHVYYKMKDKVNFVREALDSKCEEPRAIDVYDLDSSSLGKFDIVMFFGVFYHLKHPYLALEKIRSVCNDKALLLTETLYNDGDSEELKYFKEKMDSDKYKATCAPTINCLKLMLDFSGFSVDALHESKHSNRYFCVSEVT